MAVAETLLAPHFKSLIELLDSDANLVLVGTKYHYTKESMPRVREINQKVDKKNLKTNRKLDDWKYPNHIEILDITNSQRSKILDSFNFNIQKLSRKKDSLLRRKIIDFGVSVILDFEMESDLRDQIIQNATDLEKIISRKLLEELPISQRKILLQEAINLCESKRELLQRHQIRMNKTYQYIKRETRNFQSKGF